MPRGSYVPLCSNGKNMLRLIYWSDSGDLTWLISRDIGVIKLNDVTGITMLGYCCAFRRRKWDFVNNSEEMSVV